MHPGDTDASADHDDVVRTDRALMRARAVQDRATYERLTAPEYVGVDAAGTVTTREERLAGFAKLVYTSLETDEHRVRLFGDMAIVTARMRAEGHVGDDAFKGEYRYTHVYRRTGEGWRAIAAHACRIAD